MKPNYCLWEHLWYLGKMNCKWVEQLQELCFDRKELFGNEQFYLNCMDSLKKMYEINPQVAIGKQVKKTIPKDRIDIAKKSGELAKMVERLIKTSDNLDRLYHSIMIDTTKSAKESVKLIRQLLYKYPEEKQYYGFPREFW
jgi:hypothetical protein